MSNRLVERYNLLTAQAATGESEQIQVSDFRNAIIALGTASSANLTVKIKGGIMMQGSDEAETYPDLSAARSATNIWDYIEVVDLEDGAGIDGDTGIGWTGTDDYRIIEVNTNALDFLSIEVTARSAGSVSAFLTLVDNS